MNFYWSLFSSNFICSHLFCAYSLHIKNVSTFVIKLFGLIIQLLFSKSPYFSSWSEFTDSHSISYPKARSVNTLWSKFQSIFSRKLLSVRRLMIIRLQFAIILPDVIQFMGGCLRISERISDLTPLTCSS